MPTIGPLQFALSTSLDKFVRIQLKFPSIGQSNDRHRASGRISQPRDQEANSCDASDRYRIIRPRYPFLAAFSAVEGR
jgi:hypothetical protein